MAKYVDDGFLIALVVKAHSFCTGEFHSPINPEIALAYLDAAEALGADPNKGNITINDIRKKAETQLSSVEDKNAFWKDQLQDRSGFAEQLATLGLDLVYGVTRERDFDVGSKLMIAAATAGYNENNMIGRVAGVYGIIGNIELVDLWEKRAESYRVAEKSKAEERLAREHPQEQPQDQKEESKPFTAMKSNMLSSQERESDIREKMQEFAKKSLSMDPTDLSRALDGISDKETECLIGIYESYRSDPSKQSQEFTVALNMTLASQKREIDAEKAFIKACPSIEEYDTRSFPEKSDWIKCRKEYEQVYKESPIGTEQEYEEAYERAESSFEKAKERFRDAEKKTFKTEGRMRESFGKLSPKEQLYVLDSLSRASTDMFCRADSRSFSTMDDRRIALEDTFEKLVNIHAKQIGQSPDSVKRSVNECLGGWPPRIPDAYRNGEIKKVEQHNQQHNKLKSSRH